MPSAETQCATATFTKDASSSGSDNRAPAIELPKGGGAIRGIGEKFVANPVTGTGSMSVPIATSPGRSGFGPQLSLSYDSGSGNSAFGFGWSLSLPNISRKTDQGLPQYLDAEESDVFLLSGSEDLVPVLQADGKRHADSDSAPGFLIHRYRPRVEGLFARIERWSKVGSPREVHWRSVSRDNILTVYGFDAESRIADPLDPSRIFTWLVCETRDDKGNAARYRYKKEDGQGVDLARLHQSNRGALEATVRTANRYLKRIQYGNRTSLLVDGKRPADFPDRDPDWMFEVVFDYGDHDPVRPRSDDDQTVDGAGTLTYPWPPRPDPFSTYRAGFEVRTARLCRRVLMFHHFPGAAGVERDCLVRSTNFSYADEADPGDPRSPVYTFLRSVTQTGYRRNDAGYVQRSLPPLAFEYSKPTVQDTVEEVDAGSLEGLPIGLDGKRYQFTDVHGEGIPGILTEQGKAWIYKRNWSPLPEKAPDGREVVKAKFAPVETLASKPNAALAAGAQFMDLAGDGLPDVVVLDGPVPGLYEHDETDGWENFRVFPSRLNRNFQDPNLRFIDLDGDGHADVLVTEDNAFVWHASLAEEGFGPARRVTQALDEEKAPRVVFADAAQSIYLADMSGDGLSDIVRISFTAMKREICYWPNLGYGRFGAKVSMDNIPAFDDPDQFDHARIRLADVDGSGTTDIIYLHRDGVRLYFNQSGNGWSQPRQLKAFPRIDDAASIQAVDLLVNGTTCLVWSSPSPGDTGHQMRYVNLMGRRKPHLLVKIINNLGAETRIDYAPSTRFYLQDKRDGKPWMTRLPFPVQVVERVETWDHISHNRFLTRYAYHHGCFDGKEREFRGFGMVEQWDTEEFAAFAGGELPADNIAAESHVPPVHTKTWFHTGVARGGQQVPDYFAGEYFHEPGLSGTEAETLLLAHPPLPPGLTLEEQREACRALKGSMLRQEVYADDAGPGAQHMERARTPYFVTEHSFSIRVLQPRGANRHAVFFTHEREALSYEYERIAADPRIGHRLALEVDAYGNILKQAAIGYGRRKQVRIVDAGGDVQKVGNPGLAELDDADQDRQTTELLTYTENRVTNAIASPGTQHNPLPCETTTFELTGYTATGPAGRYQASDFVEPDPGLPGRLRHKFAAPEVAYEAAPAGAQRRRPIERQRTLYRRDDLTGLLPLGELESLALPGESYKLAFTPGLLARVFERQGLALLPAPPLVLAVDADNALAVNRGGYVDLDGDQHWWVPSGRPFFSTDPADGAAAELAQAEAHFFLPRRYRDPFGHDALVDFDANDLLVAETQDAVGNRVTVDAIDYRVLQPSLVSDPNRNQTEVAFDTLGMVVGTAVMGQPDQDPRPGDRLDPLFLPDLAEARIDDLMGNPREASSIPGESAATQIVHDLLASASTRVVYDVGRYMRLGEAPFAVSIARETHASDLPRSQKSKLQISVDYSDGFGRVIQKKVQAEPGPVVEGGPVASPRWVGSGWTIFNNKGKPVRQYEPFFTATHRFEFGVIAGVSPVLFYDPASRVIATLRPDHSYEKVVFSPWHQTSYDANDTCAPRLAQPGDARPPHTGDPRTDPDVAGYVAGYFDVLPIDPAKPWQTWHAQRASGALGPHQQAAATRAAAHTDTPATTHFDVLGRPFLAVARNRLVCAGHDLDGQKDSFTTRTDLDIEGNQLAVRDERKLPVNGLPAGPLEQRIVARYAYDMLGNRIHQESMEAGARWMLNDVTGKPIRAWDSRGHDFATHYDALRRPVAHTVHGTTADSDPVTRQAEPLVAEKVEYGEPPAGANLADELGAQRLNLRTRIYRHFDSAGVATNAQLDAGGAPIEAYDFKGNLLRSTRRLVSDYKAQPNWSAAPTLEAESFEGRVRYDALNRPIQSIAPHSSLPRAKRSIIQPVFNEASLLERVDVWLDLATEPATLLDPDTTAPARVGVAGIDYDARGQRLRIGYKNGASTAYRYDPLTQRLIHLYTRRGAGFTEDCDNPAPPPDTIAAPEQPPQGKASGLQNLHYTYDPVGNITHIEDAAQQTVYFRNQRVEPGNDYVYDALYRLVQASGREHLGQLANGQRMAPTALDAFNAFHTGQEHPNMLEAMGTYIERYVYDAVGNFLQMQHRGSDPTHAGWTRAYEYLEPSLIEGGKDGMPLRPSNRLSRTALNPNGAHPPQLDPYAHDVHGNMIHMPHLKPGPAGTLAPNMFWDYKNQLRQTDLGGGGAAWYVYDASGQRVRKVWEKAAGLIEERIYLGGFEIFRRHGGPIGADTVTLERETLHVMDDKQRIALVEMHTFGAAGNDPVPARLIRYQFGNHQGSASLELDEQARIISYEEYAPYGSSTYQAVDSKMETAKRYRYTGKEWDEESGLYYHSARYYAPWLGQWASCDPEGLSDGPNLYRYCRASPLNYVDSSGTEPTKADEEQANSDDAKLQAIGVTRAQVVDFFTMTRGDFYGKHGGGSLIGELKLFWNFPREQVRNLPSALLTRILPKSDQTVYIHPTGHVSTNAAESASQAKNFNPGTPIGGVTGTVAYGVARGVGASHETSLKALQIAGAGGDLVQAVLPAQRASEGLVPPRAGAAYGPARTHATATGAHQPSPPAFGGLPVPPTRLEIGAMRGFQNEVEVARLTGGTLARDISKVTKGGVVDDLKIPFATPSGHKGSIRIDVLGPHGELILVGGPFKQVKLSVTMERISDLSSAARSRGVRGIAYFTSDTPTDVLERSRGVLGKENVILFDRPAYKTPNQP